MIFLQMLPLHVNFIIRLSFAISFSSHPHRTSKIIYCLKLFSGAQNKLYSLDTYQVCIVFFISCSNKQILIDISRILCVQKASRHITSNLAYPASRYPFVFDYRPVRRVAGWEVRLLLTNMFHIWFGSVILREVEVIFPRFLRWL